MVTNRRPARGRGTPRASRRNGHPELRRVAAAVALVFLARSGVAFGRDGCTGDCRGAPGVGMDDLRAGAHAIFDPGSAGACLDAYDRDQNGIVVAADLVGAVRDALAGCGSGEEICAAIPVPLEIPDYNFSGISSEIGAAEQRPIGALEVRISVRHSWVGDLAVTLGHAETGTSVALLDRPGYPDSPVGCGTSDIDCVFSDGAMEAAEDQCDLGPPAIGGSVRPNEPLSAFLGESLAGTWVLAVVDQSPGDIGTLDEWCLRFPAPPGPTRTPTTSAGVPNPSRTPTRTATQLRTVTRTATRSSTATPSRTPTGAAPTRTPTSGGTAGATPTPTLTSIFDVTRTPTAPSGTTPTRTPTRTPTGLPSRTPTAAVTRTATATITIPPGGDINLETGGTVATESGAVIEVLPGSGTGTIAIDASASGETGYTDDDGIVVSREHDIVASGPTEKLSGPLITLPVDLELLGDDFDTGAFSAEIFDAETMQWQAVDGMARLNDTAGTVTFQAPHLSRYRIRYVGLTGIGTVVTEFAYETDHFLIKFYCTKALPTCVLPVAGSPAAKNFYPWADADWAARGSGHAKDPATPDYIEDVGEALESALTSLLTIQNSAGTNLYLATDLSYPQTVTVTNIRKNDNGDSGLGGPARINAKLDDWREVRTTTAHELTHVIADKNYTYAGAALNRWFFEAIANLWAARAAGLTRAERIVFYTQDWATYLRVPLDKADEGSMYAAADFLEWLEDLHAAPIAADVVDADFTYDITGLDDILSKKHGTTLDAAFSKYGRLATVGVHDPKPPFPFEYAAGEFVRTLIPSGRGWRHSFVQLNHSVRGFTVRADIPKDGMLVAVAARNDANRKLESFSYALPDQGNVADVDDYLEKTTSAGKPVVVRHFGAPGTAGVTSTHFRQASITGKAYREDPHVFDFYYLEPPEFTGISPGNRVGWGFDARGIPERGSAPYVAGFNIYSRGKKLNSGLVPPAAREFTYDQADANCPPLITVVDAFGNEWPERGPLLVAPSSSAVTCCGEGTACRLAPCLSGGEPPFNWQLTVGSLPPGFGLDSASGEVSGTVPKSDGILSYTLQVTDHAGAVTTFTGSIWVCGAFNSFGCVNLAICP